MHVGNTPTNKKKKERWPVGMPLSRHTKEGRREEKKMSGVDTKKPEVKMACGYRHIQGRVVSMDVIIITHKKRKKVKTENVGSWRFVRMISQCRVITQKKGEGED